jgi:predicted dehydrogenase
MMVDDKFSIWDLKHTQAGDDEVLEKHGLESSQSGAGAADPKAIDFQWHQRNFENALDALDKNETPAVDGKEGRRAVELICAIYESIKNNGAKINL